MKVEDQRSHLRSVVTPEGVTLPFELASIPDRIGAFLLDFVISHLGAVVLIILGIWGGGLEVGLPLGLVSSFLLRNFYFAFFEIRWGGTTPGKRRYNLRVISRDGGPVTAESIFARNLTRDIEVFYPLIALSNPQSVMDGLPAWAAALAVLWIVMFAALPLFGRDHLRIGDILGGTLVVRMPETKLERDLAELGKASAPRAAGPLFSQEQLDLYGIKELQVLEDLLRKNRSKRDRELVAEVAKRIKAKIDWSGEPKMTDFQFLNAFYKAQRGRLERKLLFGKRQKEKRK